MSGASRPPPVARRAPLRRLVIVLGDQLDAESTALTGFDADCDLVWMAEVDEESSHVPSGKPRIVLFLAAMRHFRDELRARGHAVHYRELANDGPGSLGAALAIDLAALAPREVCYVQPGDWRVREALRVTCAGAGVPNRECPDRLFFSTPEEFAAWAQGRRELRLEDWYRKLRRRTGILMHGAEPAGGRFNFDQDNRQRFPAGGPGLLRQPASFAPDAVTRAVIQTVETRYADRPGDLARFDWPVTAAQAAAALEDFVSERLALFGHYQDAMWAGEPWLYHSRLAAALNLKLLAPAQVVERAVRAWRDGAAPLAAVEGFVRQILGWREFVRGVYWLEMPGYAERNALAADQALPDFYWTGATESTCLREALAQTLSLGYAHHIQRLMITGLYAQLLGVRPREVHHWYLAVYVDAVEWVELPNVLGMSQYADGGRLASKPYIASGRYIERMSDYCARCRFRPGEALGADACPFTTLYWNFLDRHGERLRHHPRLAPQVRNLDRLDAATRRAIGAKAAQLRAAAPA